MDPIDIDEVLSKLTLDQKSALVAGSDFWHSTPITALGIPAIRFSDGPNGVRGTKFFNGTPSSCVPCGTALGATFDKSLLRDVGRLLGKDARDKGVHVLLGPTMNIHRSPLGGRGFESFSEDSVLSGELGASYCLGVNEAGVIPSPKHFVCNDQEDKRIAVNAIVTQRALREIYLLPFQIVLAKARPAAIMTSYNKVNGVHAAEDKYLLQDILRGEWAWKGLVVSDWFGTYSVSAAILAGQDLEMPGPSRWRGAPLAHAVSSNIVPEHVLDQRVRTVLEAINLAAQSGIPENAEEKHFDRPEDRALLRRAAAGSVVLLKNDHNILPLRNDRSIAVIGSNRGKAKDVRFSQGAYSHKDLPLLGKHLQSADGRPGFTFRVYYEPPEAEQRELAEELHLTQSEGFLMDYADSRFRTYDFYIDMEGYLTPEDDGIYDFGVSVCGTGKLYIDQRLVVDNATKQTAGASFFGSGTREERGSMNMKAGQRYKVEFHFGSSFTSNFERRGAVAFGPGGFRFGGCKRLTPKQAISDAVAVASSSDQAVVIVGLSGEWESEGYDRPTMDLPPYNNELVEEVLKVCPNAVVVVQSGAPVTMPWVHKAHALLQAWYGGNEVGNGIADIIFGDVNPSGKLPLSFPAHLSSNPSYLNFRCEGGRVLYGEDVYVGYRYYEMTNTPVLFPFGHGLSYTTFSQSDLSVITREEGIEISLCIKNTGGIAGAEVVRVYVAPPTATKIWRPKRELKGFEKVFLQAGEEQRVYVRIPKNLATSYWDESRESWISERGEYSVSVIAGTTASVQESTFSVEKSKYWLGIQ